MIDAVTAEGHTRRVVELIERDRPPGYHPSDLEPSRTAFTRTVGFEIDWDETDDPD